MHSSSTWTEQNNAWLHLLLVASVLVYLYAPFFDHSLGFGAQSRPHRHVTTNIYGAPVPHVHSADDVAAESEHQDQFLCSLDLDAVLGLLLGFCTPQTLIQIPKETIGFGLNQTCLKVESVYLQSPVPPPISL